MHICEYTWEKVRVLWEWYGILCESGRGPRAGPRRGVAGRAAAARAAPPAQTNRAYFTLTLINLSPSPLDSSIIYWLFRIHESYMLFARRCVEIVLALVTSGLFLDSL